MHGLASSFKEEWELGLATSPNSLQQRGSPVLVSLFVNGEVQVEILPVVFPENYPVPRQAATCSFFKSLNYQTMCKVVGPHLRVFTKILCDLPKHLCEVLISTVEKVPTHVYVSGYVLRKKEVLMPKRM